MTLNGYLSLFPGASREKDRFMALAEAVLRQVTDLIPVTLGALSNYSFLFAEGKALDSLAAVFGLGRVDTDAGTDCTDEDFRAYLLAKLALWSWDGSNQSVPGILARAQGRKYGSKWIGHTVADCSGLFSWAFRKLGGTMYHGSDTLYRKYCVNKGELKKGRRTDSATLKPGTAVFVWNGKKYSHVGLYVGDGTVIEAMGTVSGVTTTKVTASKWTHWGELNGVDYNSKLRIQNADPPAGGSYGVIPTGAEGGAEESPSGTGRPTLRKGSKGQFVTEMQTMLDKLGYDLGSYGADGDFGSATEAAVKSFQSDHGLTVDGIVGKNTWAELINSEFHDRRDQSSNGNSDGCNVAAVTQIGDLDSSSTIQNSDPPAGGGEDPAGSAQTYSVTISGLDLTQARALINNYPGSVMEVERG